MWLTREAAVALKRKEKRCLMLTKSKHYSFKRYAPIHNECNSVINSATLSYEYKLANESK